MLAFTVFSHEYYNYREGTCAFKIYYSNNPEALSMTYVFIMHEHIFLAVVNEHYYIEDMWDHISGLSHYPLNTSG